MGRPFSGGVILDNSPYGNHGKITGATWKRLSNGLWYLSLDGNDDKVVVTDATSLVIRNAITIEFWFKELAAPDLNDSFLNKGDTLAIYTNPANTIRAYANSSGGLQVINTGVVSTLTWHHFVFTYDKDGGANNVNSYLDSVASIPVTATGTINDTTGSNLMIGTNIDDSGGRANIEISSLRIYNVVLTATLILNHCQQERHLFGV